jgi:error-prone DNA polymerase
VRDGSQSWSSIVNQNDTLPPPLTIEDGAIRVALSQVYGVSKTTQERIVCIREEGPFTSFFDFVARVCPARDELESLILGGGFDSLHPNRRALLWTIPEAMNYAAAINGQIPGTLALQFAEPSIVSDVKDMSIRERALFDRQILGLDVDCHIMAFERNRIKEKGGKTSHEAGQLKPGTKAFAVGNPIRLRFPPTKSGKRVVFFDLEDETGLLNVTCFDDVYVRDGHAIVCSPYVTVVGEAQDRDGHIAFLAHHVYPFRPQINEDLPADRKLPFRVADFLVG